jgi:hypothetical protein
MLSHHCNCVLSSWKLLLWWQDDPELEAIRQRRMQELMGHGGGGGVSSLIFASSHYSLYQNFGSPLSSETGDGVGFYQLSSLPELCNFDYMAEVCKLISVVVFDCLFFSQFPPLNNHGVL